MSKKMPVFGTPIWEKAWRARKMKVLLHICMSFLLISNVIVLTNCSRINVRAKNGELTIEITDHKGNKICKNRFILRSSPDLKSGTMSEFDRQIEEFKKRNKNEVVIEPTGDAKLSLLSLTGDEAKKASLSEELLAISEKFKDSPDGSYIEPDYAIFAAEQIAQPPPFPTLTPQYNTKEIWWFNRMQANDAWEASQGEGVVIAVFDTGVDYNHEDLAGNVWSPPPGGIDFVIKGEEFHCGQETHGMNLLNLNSDKVCDPQDNHSHGTWISGVIGASRNDTGIVGISHKAKILAIKVLNGEGNGSLESVINGIDLIIQLKKKGINIRVVNNSYTTLVQNSGQVFNDLKAKIQEAEKEDILFVAAAGNGGNGVSLDDTPIYPANFSRDGLANVISVASSAQDENILPNSNVGRGSIDLAAPGDHIKTTFRSGYGTDASTSIATPFVSGAAALVLSRCEMTPGKLKELLTDSADVVTPLENVVKGAKRLNVCRPLRDCLLILNNPNPPTCSEQLFPLFP